MSYAKFGKQITWCEETPGGTYGDIQTMSGTVVAYEIRGQNVWWYKVQRDDDESYQWISHNWLVAEEATPQF